MAGNWPAGANWREGAAVYVDNLKRAADRVGAHGITLLIEPLNKRDNPGYFLNTTAEAAAILKEVGRENVKLQLDLYHCQITEGDLTVRIRDLAGSYAHVQIASVPDRHEPDDGEVNFTYVLSVLDEIGYDGWVGCEYRPAATTSAGLSWAQRWGVQPRSQSQSY
jgi:hydroxypyruvate isomerase